MLYGRVLHCTNLLPNRRCSLHGLQLLFSMMKISFTTSVIRNSWMCHQIHVTHVTNEQCKLINGHYLTGTCYYNGLPQS